jgi:3',5'-cyclic AMP phosphodiesterase CpdA
MQHSAVMTGAHARVPTRSRTHLARAALYQRSQTAQTCKLIGKLSCMPHARTGLVPDQRYFYALGSADEGAKGAEWSFVQPLEADATATLRFAVAADMGAVRNEARPRCPPDIHWAVLTHSLPCCHAQTEVDGSNWDDSRVVAPLVELSMRGWDNRPAANTSARLLEEVRAGAALTLINGDISYARGCVLVHPCVVAALQQGIVTATRRSRSFGAVWEAFMDAVQPFAASAPLHTVPGNHESNWPGVASSWNTSSLDSGGECGAAYTHRFPMPAPASRDAPWYSVDAGPVHFVHFSTEHDVSPGASQLAWLAADLAAARAAGARWIVLVAHRFFYVQSSTVRARLCRLHAGASLCVTRLCGGVLSQPGRDTASGRALLDGGLEALMLQYGVDVTLTGHHHRHAAFMSRLLASGMH